MAIKICVLTPTYNSLSLLQDTVSSILSQQNLSNYSLTYIVCDGGSTDGTIDYLESVKHIFRNKNIDLVVRSKNDNGMYDALSAGFNLAGFDHDVYCYINSGDYFSVYAFDVVSKVFLAGFDWFTGMPSIYNEVGHLVSLRKLLDYDSVMISQGIYGKILPYIQQESTFWSCSAHKKIDFNMLASYKYAGDFYIWRVLSDHYHLYNVDAWLSGFRIHEGQQSARFKDAYIEEFDSIRSKMSPGKILKSLLYKIFLYAPDRIKTYFAKKNILTEKLD